MVREKHVQMHTRMFLFQWQWSEQKIQSIARFSWTCTTRLAGTHKSVKGQPSWLSRSLSLGSQRDRGITCFPTGFCNSGICFDFYFMKISHLNASRYFKHLSNLRFDVTQLLGRMIGTYVWSIPPLTPYAHQKWEKRRKVCVVVPMKEDFSGFRSKCKIENMLRYRMLK